jgi:hypothetical protein
MTRNNDDETADALRRLAEGHHDSVHDEAAPSDAIIPMEAPQNAPQPQRVRPAAPGVPVPGTPAEPKVPPARPSRPARPSAPAAPAPESSVPEPTPAQPEEPAFVSDEDDDVVVAPAPEPEAFIARKPTTITTHGPSLEFRRTLIPILLTFGVALPLTGIWWFTLDSERPLKVLGLFFPITMMVLGVILLLLAILNMAQVKRLMQQQP